MTAETATTDAGETKSLGRMDIEKILETLPHRYPFLLIDRVIEIDGDESSIGIKNVTFNEPIFQGHFPGKPIFPGVLIIEGMAQTAGATVLFHDAHKGERSVVLLLTIDKAKFRKPAEPGDTIEYHIKKIQRRRAMGRYAVKAIVSGTVIAEAEIGAMMVKE